MQKIAFQPLKFRRLSEMIENSMKELILTGELKAGSRLPTEKEISRQFGVSIVTVREALRGLETFGVIEKRRGRDGGVFVTQINSVAVRNTLHGFLVSKKFSARDVGQVRRIVQPASVAIAATVISSDELDSLEKNVKYCEVKIEKRKHAFNEKDFFDIEERNVEFHRLIAEATHNPVLSLTVDYVEDFLLSFKKSTLKPDIEFSRKAMEAHREILNCLKKGDGQTAEQKMLKHCIATEEYLISKE